MKKRNNKNRLALNLAVSLAENLKSTMKCEHRICLVKGIMG